VYPFTSKMLYVSMAIHLFFCSVILPVISSRVSADTTCHDSSVVICKPWVDAVAVVEHDQG